MLKLSGKMDINNVIQRVLSGSSLTGKEAYSLLDVDKEVLFEGARTITGRMCSRQFDSCSIVNARSGSCPENCKWCAQSAHWNTGCLASQVVDLDFCLDLAHRNANAGVKRFSLVTSGRTLTGQELKTVCTILSYIKKEVGISTCASLGLLDREGLEQLWKSGVKRYHCNLETAPSYFAELCTTHTIEDKLRTINLAKEIGFEVCSGGIIGMGETPRQRVELALALREIDPVSIPINILCPIPGTPLADAMPLAEDDILQTIAIFRFIHPNRQLRFAGGRNRLPMEIQIKAMRIGMNSGVVGDLLTTIGSSIDEDRITVAQAGYQF